jgi:hypothetical protein
MRACKAFYVEKLRAARDALARHESDRAADYLVAAKEALNDCMKAVPAPSGSQGRESKDPPLLSELRPVREIRQAG